MILDNHGIELFDASEKRGKPAPANGSADGKTDPFISELSIENLDRTCHSARKKSPHRGSSEFREGENHEKKIPVMEVHMGAGRVAVQRLCFLHLEQ